MKPFWVGFALGGGASFLLACDGTLVKWEAFLPTFASGPIPPAYREHVLTIIKDPQARFYLLQKMTPLHQDTSVNNAPTKQLLARSLVVALEDLAEAAPEKSIR